MPKLILIKHAKPLVDPTKSSELWRLSDEGRRQCELLADRIGELQPGAIVSSEEPKAAETAQLVAQRLSIACSTAPNLHEHDRRNVPHMRSGEFISNVELFFRKQKQLVLGSETAEQALARFELAVHSAVEQHAAGGNLAIVSHGTVIALFVQKHSDRDGFQVWREMSLPSFVVIDPAGMKLIEICNRI